MYLRPTKAIIINDNAKEYGCAAEFVNLEKLSELIGIPFSMSNSAVGGGGNKVDGQGKEWGKIYYKDLVRLLGALGRDYVTICNLFNGIKRRISYAKKYSLMQNRFSIPMGKNNYQKARARKFEWEKIRDANGNPALKRHHWFTVIPGMKRKHFMRARSCFVCCFCRNGEDLLCPMEDLCGPIEMFQSQMTKECEERVEKEKVISIQLYHTHFYFIIEL